MSVFDGLADLVFETNAEGRQIYCRGRKGYLLPDDDAKFEIHSQVKKFFIGLCLIIPVAAAVIQRMVGSRLVDGIADYSLLFGWAVYCQFRIARLVKDFPSISIRKTRTPVWDRVVSLARSCGWPTLIFMLASAMVFVAFAVVNIIIGDRLVGAVFLVVLTPFAALSVALVNSKFATPQQLNTAENTFFKFEV